MTNKKRTYKNYDELLRDELKNPEFVMHYLNEALQDENPNVFLIALKDVLNASGSDISSLSKKAHVSRSTIYRMLSKNGKPHWHKLAPLIGAMGLQIQLAYK